MNSGTVLVAVIANALVLVLGGIVTLIIYRAYRRTDWRVLRELSIGFGLVTFGALLGGGVHLLFGGTFVDAVAIQSTVTAMGFAFIVYSLYAHRAEEGSMLFPRRRMEPRSPG